MLELFHQIKHLISAETIIAGSYWVMALVVFTETGLLIGFFLPGDSLLVTAGIFAYNGHLSLLTLNLVLIPAAIIGDTVGYWIGYKSGPHIFNRKKSFLFNPDHLREAHEFYERHGGKTIILARFMPIVRTFAPLVAGMGKMNYKQFLLYNVCGGIGWVTGMTVAGYAFAKNFPELAKKLETIIIVVVFISVLPAAIPLVKRLRDRRRHKPAIEPTTPDAPEL